MTNSDKILITGGTGFLGEHLISALIKDFNVNPRSIIVPTRRSYITNHKNINYFTCDLLNLNDLIKLMIRENPTYIINLAGENGGILYNKDFPANTLYSNTICPFNVFHAASVCKSVRKFVSIISSCAYNADNCEVKDLEESEFLNGPPDKSVACHGYAKRNLFLMSHFFNQQHNIPCVSVVLPTIYGPGMRFEPYRSKFVAAFIEKIYTAKIKNDPEVLFYGNGNLVSRELIYVADAANLVGSSLFHYNDTSEVLNLSVGQTYTLSVVANKIAGKLNYKGTIKWSGELTGQKRKTLSSKKMKSVLPLGDYSPVSLDAGLEESISYYKKSVEGGMSDR